MSEIEITKLIFGIFLSVFGIVLIFLAFLLFYKYLVQEKRCISKVKGIIKRYSFVSYGGLRLPIVYYMVDGKEYKVKGPEYKWIITKTKSTPTSKNKVDYKVKGQSLIINCEVNSIVSVYKNPFYEKYPLNSEIDVFYDPNNPKLAYVLRYCDKKFCFWIMLISGIVILIIDIMILICL